MEMAVTISVITLILVVTVMTTYTVRHWIFSFARVYGRQRLSLGDAYETDLPRISVIVPMHNESLVAAKCLTSILATDYPVDKLEVLPVNDNSDDDTSEILETYARKDSRVRPVTIRSNVRGKPHALNVAIGRATADIVLVFDADYLPGRGLFRSLVAGFIDPEVGAVMGRVVPINTGRSLLTRILSMERCGGYQVDQQARYNFNLLPQYGGTVGGFRRHLLEEIGGFSPVGLAEDTELTVAIFKRGWKIAYDNRAECYEEVPETWSSRFVQLRRWSRGHNRVAWGQLWPVVWAPGLTGRQRLDAGLMIFCYMVPVLLLAGWIAALVLFLHGVLPFSGSVAMAFAVALYNAFGNFAPSYQAATAEVMDGSTDRLFLLPYFLYMFPFNWWSVVTGFIDAIGDGIKQRRGKWDKTQRSTAEAAT
jgi:cellulose synthase/poly-beta-1,6-N-acetylglucosamine synthase-like glycosyltransferase